MKRISAFLLAATLAAALPSGAEAPVDFVLKDSTEHLSNARRTKVRVDKGAVAGLRATRLYIEDRQETILLVRAQQAEDWDEAREVCRNLPPVGKWDLPTNNQYRELNGARALDDGIPLSIVLNNPFEKISVDAHPMWARSPDESVNSDNFAHKSLLYAGDHNLIEIGPKTIAALQEEIRRIDSDLANARYLSEDETLRIKAADEAFARSGAPRPAAKAGAAQPSRLPQDLDKLLNASELYSRFSNGSLYGMTEDVYALLQKPSKERLEQSRKNAEHLIVSLEKGVPTYCAAQ